MSDYDDDSVTNNLRDSANGTFVTLDDSSHFTPCGCACASAAACLHSHNSISNVVASVTIHDNM